MAIVLNSICFFVLKLKFALYCLLCLKQMDLFFFIIGNLYRQKPFTYRLANNTNYKK
jgi:hypothetical protein